MTNEELVELYQSGNKKALDLIIEQNRGIVYKLANKFYVNNTNSIDIEDLEQEGFIGLMMAAEKYKSDMENKAQFITYAVNWIYQRIYSFVMGHSSKDKGNKQFNNNCTSINTPIGIDGDIELQDTIQATENDYENVEEQLYLKQLRNELEEVMDQSNTLREREVLKLHYGWDCDICTLTYIGDVLGVSTERVRQIKYMAMRKIRNNKKWTRAMAKEYYSEKLLNINTERYTERVVDRISFAEQYFKNIEMEM